MEPDTKKSLAMSSAQRRDELGQLARTLNQMAERIRTLVVKQQRKPLRDIFHDLRILARNANPGLEIESQWPQ